MEKRRSNRRQFLKGASAADAIEDWADRMGGSCELPEKHGHAGNAFLLQLSRRAMACQFEILLNQDGDPSAPDYAMQALDLVEQLAEQMTVYRDHSEICRINRLAADRPVAVEAGLFQLLKRAVQLSDQTDGAFDITAGPLVKVWGFYRRQGAIPESDALTEAKERTGSRWIELDDVAKTVRFLRPGIEVNLGAIGKGFALDCCADLLSFNELGSFMIHGGLSSVLARGSRAGKSNGWSVGVRHPQRMERRIVEIDLHDRALGTSGSGMQFFHHQGRRYAHVLDPRTGQPADGVLSATAITPDAASADALATAFFVLGVEGTQAYCTAYPETAALLVTEATRSGQVDLHPINLDSDTWRELRSS